MNAIDTNIFLYSLDGKLPDKRRLAQQTMSDLARGTEETVLLWQVAVEFLAGLRRWQNLGRMTAERAEADFSSIFAAYPLALPSRAVVSLSIDLLSRYSLSHWDSLLVAACIEAGVETLYSEDMSDGAVYDSVTIVNPLKSPGAAN